MQNYHEDLINFCRDLIKIPSLAGNEKGVIRRAREELSRLNFDKIEVDEFGSLVGVIKNGNGPTVIFDAHMDTVGVEPINEWSFDPFGGWLEDDKIYGRGAIDMKGPAAAIAYGLSELLSDRNSFRGTVIASLSTLEEVSEGVALANIIDKYGADFIVICEATNLQLVRAQRGRAELALTTLGVPTHSSTPHFGVDAVSKMMTIISFMNQMPMPKHPFLGSGVQALTDIISTPYPATSIVPFECRATYDRRLLIGETEESVMAEIEEMIRSARGKDPEIKVKAQVVNASYAAYTGKEFEFKKFLPAWEMPEDHPIVVSAHEALKDESIGGGNISHYCFCTNGSLPDRHLGIPTIGFGPGSEDLAHRKDEYILVNDLLEGARGYTALAKALTNLD